MNVEEKVRDILFELSGEEIVDNETTLQWDLAFDSLTMITLLVEIEDVFQIQLDESDMNPFDLNSVQDVMNLVNKYCGDIRE